MINDQNDWNELDLLQNISLDKLGHSVEMIKIWKLIFQIYKLIFKQI